ncbi:hypothetical protein Scep_003611 [Stephania cephalantha]|uniref:Uncharacterized protein n=1 Tax=Stephania cephalantha TaxID=152367 RepID=A0AAP0KST4_9MAGN
MLMMRTQRLTTILTIESDIEHMFGYEFKKVARPTPDQPERSLRCCPDSIFLSSYNCFKYTSALLMSTYSSLGADLNLGNELDIIQQVINTREKTWGREEMSGVLILGAQLQRRRQELTQATPNQPVDNEMVYYDVVGGCPKGRVYDLESLGRKMRKYADPGGSTSQVSSMNKGIGSSFVDTKSSLIANYPGHSRCKRKKMSTEAYVQSKLASIQFQSSN